MLPGEASKSISAWLVPRLPLPAIWAICETPLTLTFCPPLALALRLEPLPEVPFGPVTEADELNWTLGWLGVFMPMASEPEAAAVAPFGNCHCDSRVTTTPEMMSPTMPLPVWLARTASSTGCSLRALTSSNAADGCSAACAADARPHVV